MRHPRGSASGSEQEWIGGSLPRGALIHCNEPCTGRTRCPGIMSEPEMSGLHWKNLLPSVCMDSCDISIGRRCYVILRWPWGRCDSPDAAYLTFAVSAISWIPLLPACLIIGVIRPRSVATAIEMSMDSNWLGPSPFQVTFTSGICWGRKEKWTLHGVWQSMLATFIVWRVCTLLHCFYLTIAPLEPWK